MSESKLTDDARIAWLQHQWVMAGVVASAARFIPIPFLDDAISTQCRRFVVARTLAASDTSLSIASFKPLYGEWGGLVARSLRTVAKAPLRLLLFPVRKIALIATSIHGVPMEIMKTSATGPDAQATASGRTDASRSWRGDAIGV